jgi:hypothetical protein
MILTATEDEWMIGCVDNDSTSGGLLLLVGWVGGLEPNSSGIHQTPKICTTSGFSWYSSAKYREEQ